MSRLFAPLTAAALLIAPLAVIGGGAQAATIAPQTYSAHALKLDGLFAAVTITPQAGAQGITVSVDGTDEAVGRVAISSDHATLTVHQERHRVNWERDQDQMVVTITVPTGTPLAVNDFIGSIQAGDLGDLAVSGLHSGHITTGAIGNGTLTVTGSGDITTGAVGGGLQVNIDGSGRVKTGPTHAAVGLEVNGSGDIVVARVDGPVSAAVHGSGDITIQDGKAHPLSVELAGSGDFTLHGEATSQVVHHSGSGQVTISR